LSDAFATEYIKLVHPVGVHVEDLVQHRSQMADRVSRKGAMPAALQQAMENHWPDSSKDERRKTQLLP